MEAKLVVVGGESRVSEVQLKLPTVIGRGRNAKLTLPHPLVSRQHCEIYEDAQRLMVNDLGSLNGTFIGDQRLTGPTPLMPGDLLTVGTVTFRAVYELIDELANANQLVDSGATAMISPGEPTLASAPKASAGEASRAEDLGEEVEFAASFDDENLEADFVEEVEMAEDLDAELVDDADFVEAATAEEDSAVMVDFDEETAEAEPASDFDQSFVPGETETAEPVASPDTVTADQADTKDLESAQDDDDLATFLKEIE